MTQHGHGCWAYRQHAGVPSRPLWPWRARQGKAAVLQHSSFSFVSTAGLVPSAPWVAAWHPQQGSPASGAQAERTAPLQSPAPPPHRSPRRTQCTPHRTTTTMNPRAPRSCSYQPATVPASGSQPRSSPWTSSPSASPSAPPARTARTCSPAMSPTTTPAWPPAAPSPPSLWRTARPSSRCSSRRGCPALGR